MSRKAIWFWTTFVLALILDQATKIWVYTNLEYRVDEIQVIPGFLSIVHAQNPGAAFGILVDFEHRHLVFLAFTVVALGVIADMYRKVPGHDRLLGFALGLILSGAVGNAIDRVHKRTVTDFIRMYSDNPSIKPTLIEWFGTNEWPSYNVADAALLIGVILFMAHSMLVDDGDEAEPAAKSPPNDAPLEPPDESARAAGPSA